MDAPFMDDAVDEVAESFTSAWVSVRVAWRSTSRTSIFFSLT